MQGGGHRFDPDILHQFFLNELMACSAKIGVTTKAGIPAQDLRKKYSRGQSMSNINNKSKEHTVDALAQNGDEGRGKLRKVTGSCKHALIRKCPNGATQLSGA